MQLEKGEIHMLKLTKKANKDANGWAKVSKAVWPSVRTLPSQLVELQETNDGGFIRLTREGETVLDFLNG